jgi:hypothetical protein
MNVHKTAAALLAAQQQHLRQASIMWPTGPMDF